MSPNACTRCGELIGVLGKGRSNTLTIHHGTPRCKARTVARGLSARGLMHYQNDALANGHARKLAALGIEVVVAETSTFRQNGAPRGQASPVRSVTQVWAPRWAVLVQEVDPLMPETRDEALARGLREPEFIDAIMTVYTLANVPAVDARIADRARRALVAAYIHEACA